MMGIWGVFSYPYREPPVAAKAVGRCLSRHPGVPAWTRRLGI